jgi:hypothetical protein
VPSKTIDEVRGYANPTANSGGYTYTGEEVLFISLACVCLERRIKIQSREQGGSFCTPVRILRGPCRRTFLAFSVKFKQTEMALARQSLPKRVRRHELCETTKRVRIVELIGLGG